MVLPSTGVHLSSGGGSAGVGGGNGIGNGNGNGDGNGDGNGSGSDSGGGGGGKSNGARQAADDKDKEDQCPICMEDFPARGRGITPCVSSRQF